MSIILDPYGKDEELDVPFDATIRFQIDDKRYLDVTLDPGRGVVVRTGPWPWGGLVVHPRASNEVIVEAVTSNEVIVEAVTRD
jgi:hypothetical protein